MMADENSRVQQGVEVQGLMGRLDITRCTPPHAILCLMQEIISIFVPLSWIVFLKRAQFISSIDSLGTSEVIKKFVSVSSRLVLFRRLRITPIDICNGHEEVPSSFGPFWKHFNWLPARI